MKTLYIDCSMGAAGDMLTSALLELMPDPEGFIAYLNSLNIPGVTFIKDKAVKCGICGTHVRVMVGNAEEGAELNGHEHHEHEHEHDHEHHEHGHHEHGHHPHTGLKDVDHIVSGLDIPDNVKQDVMSVYGLIAGAESHVHGKEIEEIHFHEVGTMDAIADVVAVSLLMDELSVDEVIASPVHLGSGEVRCAHGILPVPAPATAFILKDIPVYTGSIRGELCTPTGAALLKHFADSFAEMPVLKINAIGYGMGSKDFERANCVRVMLGETADITEGMLELSCNVDDMTAEDISFAVDRLFKEGAREVYTVPIGMKKSRTGTLIRVICSEDDRDEMIRTMFRHTSTIGIRESAVRRYILERHTETVKSPFGEVRKKISSGYGVSRMKYEYDDIARIAGEMDLNIDEIRRKIENDG